MNLIFVEMKYFCVLPLLTVVGSFQSKSNKGQHKKFGKNKLNCLVVKKKKIMQSFILIRLIELKLIFTIFSSVHLKSH